MRFKHALICCFYFIGVSQLTKDVNYDVSKSTEIDLSSNSKDGSTCKSGQVLNGSGCISVTNCTKPVLWNRQCLQRCPEGYIYFTMGSEYNFDYTTPRTYHYTTADINENPCLKKTMIWLLIGFAVIANIAYILFVWLFLSTQQFSTKKMKYCFVRFFTRGRQDEERALLLNTDTDDDDDGSPQNPLA